MKKNIISVFTLFFFLIKGFSQSATEDTLFPLKFFIGEQVINANDPNEKQIIKIWKDYLKEGKFGDSTSSFWSFEDSQSPGFGLLV